MKKITPLPAVNLPSTQTDPGVSPLSNPQSVSSPAGPSSEQSSNEEISDVFLESIPFKLTPGNIILFKKRGESRVFIGKILDGVSATNLWSVHTFLHQVSSSIPKVNGHHSMNIFEPLVDRRFQLEYTYFGPNNELFACGLEPKKASPKFTPVTVDFNPSDYDVIIAGPSKKSLSNTCKKLRLKPAFLSLIYDIVDSWDTNRGTPPLGIRAGDSVPSCAFIALQLSSQAPKGIL